MSESKPTSPKTEQVEDDGTSGHGASGAGDVAAADDEDVEPPSVVIYIVDPFTFASDNLDLGRLTALGLLRCYHQMLSLLTETIQLNMSPPSFSSARTCTALLVTLRYDSFARHQRLFPVQNIRQPSI